jgi:DME family drug/metabolite transporter
LLDPFPALISAVIWGIGPIYYRSYLDKMGTLAVNLVRTGSAAAVLFIPFLVFGFDHAIVYAFLSGVLTLSLGDTLYLVSIKSVGASVAAPVAYVYVVLVQFLAIFVGEPLTIIKIASASLVVIGVYVLSGRRDSRLRMKGILTALGAALLWSAGQVVIKIVTNSGDNPLSIAFGRNVAAAALVGLIFMSTPSFRRGAWGNVSKAALLILAAISVADLVVGSSFFIYSVATIGVTTTIILTSISPLLTQVVSKTLGKESPSNREIGAGLLIVLAIVLSVF